MSTVSGEPRPVSKTDELSQEERAELGRLRTELTELRRGQAGQPRRGRLSWRAPVAAILIVLGCVLAPVAVLGVWAGNQVSDTGRWVTTVEPLIHDPAIQNVLTDKITNEISSQLNLTGTINQAATQLQGRGLPRLSTLLVTFGPQISGAVTGALHSSVHTAISSQAMANAWVQVNTVAHQALVGVLSGHNNGALTATNGQIVLNLGPLIAVAKKNLVARGFTLASSIPSVNPTVALFQANDLGKAQAGYRAITNLKILLPIVVLLLLGLGVFTARGRRRALISTGLGVAASMVVLAIAVLIARTIYLNSVPSSVLPSDAAAAAFDTLVHFIRVSLRVVLAVGLVVALGAFVTGPSRAAVQTRAALGSAIAWLRQFGERRGVSAGPVGQWTHLHRRVLRIGAVAIASLILVFWGQPTALTVIFLVIVLLVLLGLIELIGRPPPVATTAPDAAGPA